ncbi:MAG: hypothetical protein AAF224_07940 [Pseudomonadota bacterium]
MRFVLIAAIAVLLILAGLFFYGASLSPETRTIIEEAVRAPQN